MAQNTLGFVAAAVGTGVAAKAIELPTPFAGLAAAAVFVVCMGVSSLLKVDVPKPAPKAKKPSKAEKRKASAAAAAANYDSAADDAEEARLAAKAAKKRAKEQARKAAKREAAAQAATAAAKQQKQEADEKARETTGAGEKKLTKEQAKKKKQKEKAKAKKAAAAAGKEVVVMPPAAAAAAATAPTDWEEVKVKKGKKKVDVEEEVSTGDKPQHVLSFYVERKHFRVVIGPGGSHLRAIIEATGCEIELPKEGGIQMETILTGTESGCLKAKAAIEQLVAKGYSSLTHSGTVDTTVAVPDAKRGLVIGPKGANLKLLQEKLGVKINFPEKGSEDDVQIMGDSKAVQEAKAAILSLVQKGFSSITHENFIQTNIEVARDLLKNLIGPGGQTIKHLQKTTNVQINVSSEKSGETVVVSLLGEPEGIAECRTQIVALMVPPEPTPIAPEWQQAASLHHVEAW